MSLKNLSPEDRLDRVYRLVALLFLTVGVLYVIRALQYVLPQGGWFTALSGWIKIAVIVVGPVLSGLTIWRSFAFKRACVSCSLVARDGFVFGAIQKSGLRAGFLGFLSLVVLHEVADEPALPAKFFLSLGLAVLTLTFSISFLTSSHVGNAEE